MGEPVELLEDADIDIREGEGINSQVFGRFLLGRGVVTLKTLMLALRQVNSGGERLGDLAVNQGFLSREDVDSILERQSDGIQAFGRTAVEMELLTVNQVNSLLILQRRSKGGIGDALVALGHVTQQDMDRFFDEFEQTQLPQAAPNFDDSPHGKTLLNFLSSTFPDLAKTIASIEVKVEPPVATARGTPLDYTATLTLSGELTCQVTLSVSGDFAKVIMWGLFGADFVNDVDMYPDAIGEFLNMLVGNVGRSLEKEGIKARGEAPVFIEEVPDSGKHLRFVVTNLLIDGEEPRAVAPSATGILYLSNAE
jgi:CheY-specific phosphatase CheX